MSTSRLQELLAEQKLTLQDLSDRSGLPIETIQAIELQVQEVFTNLQKIAQSLNTTVPQLLELFRIPNESDRSQWSPRHIPSDFPGPFGPPSPDECKRNPNQWGCPQPK